MSQSQIQNMIHSSIESLVSESQKVDQTQKTNLEEQPGSAKKHAVSTFPYADFLVKDLPGDGVLFVFNYNSKALR